MIEPGARVRVPNADDTAEVHATFLEAGAPDEAIAIETPHVPGGTVIRDVGWVRYEDGTTRALPYSRIQPL